MNDKNYIQKSANQIPLSSLQKKKEKKKKKSTLKSDITFQ